MSAKSSETSGVAVFSPHPRSVLNIIILGHNNVGIMNTAARQNLAGHSLYKIFKEHNQTFVNKRVVMKLADYSSKN